MRRLLPLLALLTFMLSTLWFTAMAHGGGQLIAGPVEAGPYMVSVWVNPPQPSARETLHYTVGLAAPLDGAPVLDAEIMITMQTMRGSAPPVTAPATTEQSVNKLFYETDMIVDAAGRYMVTFDVNGPAGSGQLDLELEVREPSPVNWFLLGLAGLGLVILLGWWRARAAKSS